jgi:hypothetical protein
MNEEALKDSYKLFQDTGYNGSIEDYNILIESNPDALNDAHKLFQDTGYNGSVDEFSALVGLKKKDQAEPSQDQNTESLSEASQLDTENSQTEDGGSESITETRIDISDEPVPDLQEDLPPEVFQNITSKIEGQISKIETQIKEEKANTIPLPINRDGFQRPQNQPKLSKLEETLREKNKTLKDYQLRLAKSEAKLSGAMVGEDPSKMEDMAAQEKSLEGGTLDFIERAGRGFIRTALQQPLLQYSEAEVKQRSKEMLEKEINQEVESTSKRLQGKQRDLSDKGSKLTETLDEQMSINDSAYTNDEINFEQYQSNQNAIFDGYTSAIKPLEEQIKNISEFGNSYVNSLNDLAVYANYDDMGSFESGTKSIVNEIIKTPRQAAGVMKSMAPLLEIVSSSQLGNQMASVPSEVYLDMMEPLTDILTNVTDRSLLKIDSEEEAANMIGSTMAQLAKIIPASMAAPVAGLLVTAGMSFDEMYDLARNTEGISEAEAVDLASIYMPIGMSLEFFGARTGVQAFGKAALKREVINMVKSKGLLSISKKEARRELNTVLIRDYGKGILIESIEEGTTEMLQSVVMEGIKASKNYVEGKDIFEVGGQNFADDLVTSFVFGGIAGGAVQVVAGFKTISTDLDNKLGSLVAFDKYTKAITDEGTYIAVRKRITEDKTMSPDQMRDALDVMDFDKETMQMIPEEMTGVKRQRAAELITDKRLLENQKAKIDKSLAMGVDERIKEIDTQLQALVAPQETNEELTNIVAPQETTKTETNEKQQEEGGVQPQEDPKQANEEDGQQEEVGIGDKYTFTGDYFNDVEQFKSFKEAKDFAVNRVVEDIGILDESKSKMGNNKSVEELSSILKTLGLDVVKIPNNEMANGNYAQYSDGVIQVSEDVPLPILLHEIGEHFNRQLDKKGLLKHSNNIFESSTIYGASRGNDAFSDNFYLFFAAPRTLQETAPDVYSELDKVIPKNIKDGVAAIMKEYGVKEQYFSHKQSKQQNQEAEVAPAKQVEKLRAEEQAELLKAIPNIEEARVDGEVDKAKLSEADRKTFDKIYEKYDKLITPLLEESATETTKEKPKQAQQLDLAFDEVVSSEPITIEAEKSEIAKEAEKKTTAIMNKVISESDREKAKDAKDDIRITDKEMLEGAKERVDSGRANPQVLAEQLSGEPRVLSPEEVAELTYYKMQLLNRIEATQERYESSKKKDPVSEESITLRMMLKSDYNSMDVLNLATELAGTRQAQAFRLRQLTVDQEFSLVNQVREFKIKNDRETVPAETMREFEKLNKENRELKERLEEWTKKSQEEGKLVTPFVKETKTKGSKKPFVLSDKEKKRRLELRNKYSGRLNDVTAIVQLLADAEFYEYAGLTLKEAGNDFSEFSRKMTNSVGKGIKEHLPKLYKDLGGKGSTTKQPKQPELVDGLLTIPDSFTIDLIQNGFDTIDTATKEAKRILKDVLGIDATDRQVRIAISDYGKRSKPNEDPNIEKLSKIKRLGRLISALEDVKKKKRPLKTGAKRDKVDQDERELTQQINELLKEIPLTEQEQEGFYKTAYEKMTTRLKNKIEDLEKQLKDGKGSRAKNPIKHDADSRELQSRIDTLKAAINDKFGKPKETFKQKVDRLERALQLSIQQRAARIAAKDYSDPVNVVITTPSLEKLRAEDKRLAEEYKKAKKEFKDKDKPSPEQVRTEKLREEIIEIDQKIANNDLATTPKTKKIESDAIEKLKTEKAAKLKELNALRKAAKPSTRMTTEERQMRVIDRKREVLQKKIMGEEDVFAERAAKKQVTAAVQSAEDSLNDLREQLKETQQYKDAVEAKSLANSKRVGLKYIADYERRIKEGDFETKKKKDKTIDEELKDIQMKQAQVKDKFQIEQERARLKLRNNTEKMMDNIYNTITLPRTLMASVDLSAPLRQGMLTTFSNMYSSRGRKANKEAFGEMFAQAFSKERYDDYITNLSLSEDYIFAKTMGLEITMTNAKMNAREEMFMNSFASRLFNVKWKGKKYGWGSAIDASSRAYSAYLNVIRMSSFNTMADQLASNGYSPTSDAGKKAYKGAATLVNNLTGRGDIFASEGGKTDKALNALFFAPKYVMSRLNLVVNPVFYANLPPPIRLQAAKIMSQAIATNLLIATLASALGADVEDDPRSSDWGKLKFGNLRLDTWGGLQQPLRLFLAGIVLQETKSTSTGAISELNTGKYGDNNSFDAAVTFIRTKSSPATGFLVDRFLTGDKREYAETKNMKFLGLSWKEKMLFKNVIGQDQTTSERIGSMIAPLFLQDVFEISRQEGLGMTVGAIVAGGFGMGSAYYLPREIANSSDYKGIKTKFDNIKIEDSKTDLGKTKLKVGKMKLE